MKTLTVTEVASNFSAVMDGVESEQQEIVLVRNNKPIARLVPEPPAQNALEVLGDLYHTLGADNIHEMTKQAPIYLSPVNVAEIRYGIELMKDDKQKQRAMSTLRRIRREPLLRITREVGTVFICRRITVRQPVRLSSGSNAMKLSIA